MKFQYCGTQYYRAKEAILLFGGQRVLVPVKLLMGFVFFQYAPISLHDLLYISDALHTPQTNCVCCQFGSENLEQIPAMEMLRFLTILQLPGNTQFVEDNLHLDNGVFVSAFFSYLGLKRL